MATSSLNILFAVSLVSLTVIPAVEGYLLAWPYGTIDDETTVKHPRNVHSRPTDTSLGSGDSNDTSEEQQMVEVCKSDKACGRGFYCDRHYGECHPHRGEREPCRRDGHCDRGLECLFGTCQQALMTGTVGARCKSDKDCGDNMCCAKQHGESICKARLPLNAKCYVPAGGVEYTIDSICPCVDGLTCRRVQETREEELVWQFWTDYEHMRCAPIRVPPRQ